MHVLKVVIDVGSFQVLLEKKVIINLNQGRKEEMTLFNKNLEGMVANEKNLIPSRDIGREVYL
jgi:hypothetical protein